MSISLTTFSRSWQVSNVNATADFDNLTMANARAQSGDTIFVEGTGNPYEGATITKKLVLIGPGYFLVENQKTHFNKMPAVIKSHIIFETGSLGSEIIGFDFRHYNVDVRIRTSNITIKRNRLSNIVFLNQSGSIIFDDIKILQNYIENSIKLTDNYS
jgi:hypothetical protein